jgi:hypothetical protein
VCDEIHNGIFMLGIITARYGTNMHPNNALTGQSFNASPNAQYRQLILHMLVALVHRMFINVVRVIKIQNPFPAGQQSEFKSQQNC